MVDKSKARPDRMRDGWALFLAMGGLAAALAGAACCALPTLLGSLGLGSALLGAVALMAGPYRLPLSAAALLCLSAAGGLLLRRHGARRARPWLRAVALAVASVVALLVVLTAVIA